MKNHRITSRPLVAVLCVGGLLLSSACEEHFTNHPVETDVVETVIEQKTFNGQGYGQPCGEGLDECVLPEKVPCTDGPTHCGFNSDCVDGFCVFSEDVTCVVECRDGLECLASGGSNVCLPTGNKGVDEKCLLTSECQPPSWIALEDGEMTYVNERCTPAQMKAAVQNPNASPSKLDCFGLHCSWAGFCVAPDYFEEEEDDEGLQALKQGGSVKAGQPGSSCAHSGECEYGLFCNIRGLGGVCAKAGNRDLDESCVDEEGVPSSKLCLAGLVCSKLSETCVPGSLLLNPDLFEGIKCWEGAEAEMPFGVRTFIPPLDTTDGTHPSAEAVTDDDDGLPYEEIDEGSIGGCYAYQTTGDLCTNEEECTSDGDCDDSECLLPAGYCKETSLCGDDICGDDGVCRRCISDLEYDFYSLPFPNDIRTNKEEGDDRHMVIADHPRPGPGLLGLDPIDSVIEAIGEELHGWSIQPGIFMRFTRPLNVETLTPGDNARLVYIPPQEGPLAGVATEHPFEVTFVPQRGKYICNNQLVAHPVWSKPLAANSTYAFIVTNNVRSESVVDANACAARDNPELSGGYLAGCVGCWCEEVVCREHPECCDAAKKLADVDLGNKGWNQACVDACVDAGQTCEVSEAPQQLDHLPMLLSSAAPEDSALLPAWESYERFRQWLQTDTLSADDIAGVTLFTTGDPTELMGKVEDAIESRYQPEFGIKNSKAQVHSCREATGPSPCGDPGWADNELSEGGTIPDPRLCPPVEEQSDWYDEWHIRLKIPKIQVGKRPYLEVGTGGEVNEEMVNDPNSELTTETICVSLTVPTEPPPTQGYPVLVYGHGTGGSFRTAPTLLGSIATDPANPVQYVLVGYDAHMHGDRGGNFAELDSGLLYYNFANPPAAKGNFFQQATDVFAASKFASQLEDWVQLLPQNVPGAVALKNQMKVDESHIAYHGHSQGGAAGPLVAPFDTHLGALVVSGTGGNLIEGLLGKKMPYDISTALSLAVQEIDLDANHPAMHLLQTYFDAVDATPYAPLLHDPPNGGVHLLDIVGMSDTFTPPPSARIYAAATGATLVEPFHTESVEGFDYTEDLGLAADLIQSQSSMPIASNRQLANGSFFTQVITEHPTSSAYDGHFVIYQDEIAAQLFANFLGTWVLVGVPGVTDQNLTP